MNEAASRAPARVPGGPRRVLVTRPADQAASWVEALQQHGINAQALPLIGIQPVSDPCSVDQVWACLPAWALLVFVSPNAASQFFARRPPGFAWPDTTAVASPGPGTSEVLRRLGVPAARLVEPAADATQFDSESLWAQLVRRPWAGQRVCIVRGEGGREWLAEQLTAAGAEVEFVAAYRRGAPVLSAQERSVLAEALDEPARHLWLLSSSESLDHLAEVAGRPTDQLVQALREATAIATHPRIAGRAAAAGFGTVRHCRPTVEAVVACIQSSGPPTTVGAPHATS